MSSTPTKAAATERAKRSLWTGLALDLAVAVATALLVWLPGADVSSTTAWVILGTTLLKTVLQAAASYVLRLKVQPATELADGAFVITDLDPVPLVDTPPGGTIAAGTVRAADTTEV